MPTNPANPMLHASPLDPPLDPPPERAPVSPEGGAPNALTMAPLSPVPVLFPLAAILLVAAAPNVASVCEPICSTELVPRLMSTPEMAAPGPPGATVVPSSTKPVGSTVKV